MGTASTTTAGLYAAGAQNLLDLRLGLVQRLGRAPELLAELLEVAADLCPRLGLEQAGDARVL